MAVSRDLRRQTTSKADSTTEDQKKSDINSGTETDGVTYMKSKQGNPQSIMYRGERNTNNIEIIATSEPTKARSHFWLHTT